MVKSWQGNRKQPISTAIKPGNGLLSSDNVLYPDKHYIDQNYRSIGVRLIQPNITLFSKL